MSTKFDGWMLEFKKTPEWQDDSFCWDDMAKSAYNAGLQRAAEIAELKGLNQDCSGKPFEFYQYGKDVSGKITAAICAELAE